MIKFCCCCSERTLRHWTAGSDILTGFLWWNEECGLYTLTSWFALWKKGLTKPWFEQEAKCKQHKSTEDLHSVFFFTTVSYFLSIYLFEERRSDCLNTCAIFFFCQTSLKRRCRAPGFLSNYSQLQPRPTEKTTAAEAKTKRPES